MVAMYKLYGALASPYSMKMRSLLRYRQLPFTWHDGAEVHDALAKVRAPVIPVLQFPDGHFANDSTPLVYELEALHEERCVVPPDPAIAFLAHLLEDFADEWLTKAMFGWRWLAEIDQVQMSRWLAFDRMHGGGVDASQAAAQAFRERQVGRMPIVGCTAENFPVIEASTHAVLQALEAHVTEGFFLFGSRPSLAEFGLLGQLSQLATDPTPQAMMREQYPYTYRWLTHLDDLSGHDGEWADQPADAALRIAQVAGEVYAPLLTGNTAALAAGEDTLQYEALGHSYSQPVFRYQAKCLADLRARHTALSADEQGRLAGWIGESWQTVLAS